MLVKVVRDLSKRIQRRKLDSSNPAIFLYVSRRGGGTMLMQALASSLSAAYSDQPFSLYSAEHEKHLRKIPFSNKSEMLFLDDEDEMRLKDFTFNVISGEEIYNSAARFWAKDYHFSVDRVILKVTNAKSYIAKFDAWFSPISIVMLRNPILVAKSCMSNNWGITNSAFLNNRAFVDTVLPSDLVSYSDYVEKNGSLLERHVLNWCLDHYLCIQKAPASALVIKYEDLVAKDESVLSSITKLLPDIELEKFLRTLSTPSKSSNFSESLKGKRRVEVQDLIGVSSLSNGLSKNELQKSLAIVARFKIYEKYYGCE